MDSLDMNLTPRALLFSLPNLYDIKGSFRKTTATATKTSLKK